MIDECTETTKNVVRLMYPRVYSARDGVTHFDDVAVSMAPVVFVPGIPLVDVAKPEPVSTLTFSRLETGYISDWHPSPRRQFVFIVSGTMELTVIAGETREFGPGSVFFVEDITGGGHKTRALGSAECVFITVAC